MTAPTIVTLDRPSLARKDHALRRVCPRFDFGTEHIDPIAEQLRAAIRGHDIAVGFAAPQIGIDRRVVIVNHKKKTFQHEKLLVNPVVLRVGTEPVEKFESCMSLPGWRAPLVRPNYVEVEFWNEKGERETIEASGYLARILFHEIDHLNGVLYTDHLESLNALEPVTMVEK